MSAASRAPESGAGDLDDAMELMHFAFRRVVSEPDRLLAERDFGRLHHRLLYVVGKNPGMAVGELIDLLDITKQAMHAPLKDLVRAKLVNVSRACGDRRVKTLRLTPVGKRYERRLAEAEHRVFAEAFERAGPRAVMGWRKVMDSLGLGRRLRVSPNG
jgi:DNA-binding MarR family transcriptional regulator